MSDDEVAELVCGGHTGCGDCRWFVPIFEDSDGSCHGACRTALLTELGYRARVDEVLEQVAQGSVSEDDEPCERFERTWCQ